jgi:hypothetical protein
MRVSCYQNWRVFLELVRKTPALHQYLDLVQKYPELLRCKPKELFAQELKSLKKPLDALIAEAARIRISALHREVQEIQKGIHPEDWKKLCVAVMGPPMPREGELSMQYFEKILAIPEGKKQCPYERALTSTAHLYGGHRLIYAESIYKDDEALDLITTHICDTEVGRDVLDDPSALRADVLKNAAQKCLRESFP